jgi:hypothetical protein
MTQFDPIFAALQATGVRYVVVGGVAVNLHGYQRFTKDIDLVVELVPDQALKALEALQNLGYKPNVPVKLSDFADPTIREGELWSHGTKIDLPETSLRIASIDHLVLMKRQAGRPQDLLDVEKLEKLKQIMAERGDAPK